MIKYFSLLTLLFLFSCTDENQSKGIQDDQLHVGITNLKILAQPAKQDEGNNLYLKYCLACHQMDGSGVPGMYPPLKKSDWVNGDKKRIINVLIKGLEGDITVKGQSYSSSMPKQDYLSNKQIAQVLSYVRKNFGNQADSVKVREVSSIRK